MTRNKLERLLNDLGALEYEISRLSSALTILRIASAGVGIALFVRVAIGAFLGALDLGQLTAHATVLLLIVVGQLEVSSRVQLLVLARTLAERLGATEN